MLTLQGTLRQFGDIEIGEENKRFLKLWVEHETPRDNGPSDLKISELLIPKSAVGPEAQGLKKGAPVSVAVRAYVSGRSVAFSAVGLNNIASSAQSGSESK